MNNRRIWIFQADSLLTEEESNNVQKSLSDFISQWFSHGNKLQAEAIIEKNLFVIFKLDEALFQASGCSIDKMNHYMQLVGQQLDKDFFNRQLIALEDTNGIRLVHIHDIPSLISEGSISSQSKMYDHLIQTEEEFEDNWIKILDKSWANRFTTV